VVRSAYFFPAFLVALLIVAKREEPRVLRIYCFLAFVISALGGNYYIAGDKAIWMMPLPVKLFEEMCRIVQQLV
jgi:disulfide bond formation protein DsbB